MVLDASWAILGLAVLVAASLGLGGWIERLLPPSLLAMERVAAVCLGGVGLLGAGMFVVGLVSFTPGLIIPVCALAAIGGLVRLRRFRHLPSIGWRALPGHARLALLIVLAVLAVTAISGLSELVGSIGHDGVNYHLLGPKQWLREGVIRPVLGNTHTAFPQTLEVVFGVGWVLGGPRTPGLTAVFTLALFLVVCAGIARRLPRVTSDWAWWCSALLATMPAVYAGAHSGFVDVAYAALVLLAARIGLDAKQPAHFIALGVFCGLAMATKYTGLIAAPMVLAMVAFARWDERRAVSDVPWRLLILSGMVSVLPAAAFYVRNAIVFGCPIYPPTPGLVGLCDVRYLSVEWVKDFAEYISVRRGGGYGRTWLAFLALPFNLTYRTDHFHGAGGIGLVPLALAPLGLRVAWRDSAARALAVLALGLLSAWFLTQQESRFLIHVYAVSTCVALVGWVHIAASPDAIARRLAAAAAVLSVAYGSMVIARERHGALLAAVSAPQAERRRRAEIPHRDAFAWLNARATAKVMVMSMHIPAYYLDGDFVLAYEGWCGTRSIVTCDDDARRARWHALGITYLLDVHDEWGGYAVPSDTRAATLVFQQNGARVYRVR